MSRNEIHITKRKDGKWQAKNPENERASVTSEEKSKVMNRAREIARNQGLELIPHNEDGKI
jgi:hypothetical protein